jgi:RNA polymerase sigma-B factor
MGALEPGDGLRETLREAIIRDQMPHAWYITALYNSRGASGEDDVTLAYRSLAMAVDGFDPEGGESFLHYAVPVILREVKASRRNGAGDLASSHRARQTADMVRVGAEQLTKALGRSPSVPELAEATGECCEQIVESLDAALGHSAPWIDLLTPAPLSAAESDHGSVGLQTASSRAALAVVFTALENRAKRVLLMWFLRGMSQAQIATDLGVPQEQISRMQARSLSQLGLARANLFSASADEPDTAPALPGRSAATQTVLGGPGLSAA